ncbi:MAG: hypothetical protein HDS10_04420 [Bacteroides sp.]|nr:hypothetical protein [Bacteroides sp.]
MRSNLTTFDRSFWIYFCIAIILIIAIGFLPYLLTSTSFCLIDFSDSGQVGDTIGGIMGPFIAIVASLLTFLAFWVQFKANQQQRYDIAVERFESNLFQMLQMQESIVNGLHYSPIDGADRNYGESFQGRNVFYAIYELKGWNPDWGLKDLIKNEGYSAYEKDKEIIILDHYFRHLYRIFKYIEDSELFTEEEKYQYASMARSSLSPYELVLLFYNCLSTNGKEKFKPLIETFALFNNLRLDLLIPKDQAIYKECLEKDFNQENQNFLYKRGAFIYDKQ